MARRHRRSQTSSEIASLFPMKDGKPNPLFTGTRQRLGDHQQQSANRKLRDEGMLPIKWSGTRARFEELGIPVSDRPDIYTKPGNRPGATPGGESGSVWGPRWAVLIAEAEPCNEDARDWALARGAADEEFRDSLMTVSLFGDRRKMADYIMELWTPEEP